MPLGKACNGISHLQVDDTGGQQLLRELAKVLSHGRRIKMLVILLSFQHLLQEKGVEYLVLQSHIGLFYALEFRQLVSIKL